MKVPSGRIPRADLVGERFGRLTVIRAAGLNKHSQSLWDAHCDCGSEKKRVCISSLKSGTVKSCGCLRKEAWKDRPSRNIKDGKFTCSLCKGRLDLSRKAKGRGNYRCVDCDAVYKSAHYAANRPDYLRRASVYQKENRAHLNDLTNSRRRREPAAYLFGLARRRARVRGIEFTISLSDVVIPDLCPVLGIPLDSKKPGKRGFPLHASPTLDRFDNTKGYIPGNVAVISWRANSLKKDAECEELEALVKWMKQKDKPCP